MEDCSGGVYVAATKQVLSPKNISHPKYCISASHTRYTHSPKDQHISDLQALQVRSPEDIVRWEASEAYQVDGCWTNNLSWWLNLNNFVKEYLGFIIAIGDAVKGRKLTDEVGHVSTMKIKDKVDIFSILGN